MGYVGEGMEEGEFSEAVRTWRPSRRTTRRSVPALSTRRRKMRSTEKRVLSGGAGSAPPDSTLFSVLLIFLLLVDRAGTDLLVVLLEGRQVLTGLRELALLHALPDIPVNECTLGVHEVELVVDALEHLSDSGRV